MPTRSGSSRVARAYEATATIPASSAGSSKREAAPCEDGECKRKRDVDERPLDLVHRLCRRRRPEDRCGGPGEQREPRAEIRDVERPECDALLKDEAHCRSPEERERGPAPGAREVAAVWCRDGDHRHEEAERHEDDGRFDRQRSRLLADRKLRYHAVRHREAQRTTAGSPDSQPTGHGAEGSPSSGSERRPQATLGEAGKVKSPR